MGSRLRIHLDSSLKPEAAEYEGVHKFWWQPGPSADGCMRDILHQVAECVQLPVAAGELQAELDGFVVPLNGDASLLRDGDVLRVSHNPRKRKQEAAAPRPAAQNKRPKAAPGAAAKQLAAVGSGSSDSADSSSSEQEEEESPSEQGAKSERFFTPGDKLGSPTSDATPAAAPAEGDTAKKQPSRSARRKAAKRRLRRLGIAPSAPGSQARPDAALAAAAAADPLNPNLLAGGAGRTANGYAKKQAPAKKQQAAAPKQAAAKPKPAETSSEEESSSSEEEESSSSEEEASSSEEESSSDEEEEEASLNAAQRQPVTAPLEETFAQLPALEGRPSLGNVLAYKLLEIGPSFEPHVSEARAGRVIDLAGTQVTLEPYPDPVLHPLAAQWAERRAQRQAEAHKWGKEVEEEEEEDEGAPSQYDEAGVLAADLSSFVELRLLKGAAGTAHLAGSATPAPAAAEAAAAQEEAEEDLGPKRYSQLGPPRPAAQGPAGGGAVINPEGGWAALHAQLQQRRAQLSGGKGARPGPVLASASPTGATPAPAAGAGGQASGKLSTPGDQVADGAGRSSGKKSTPGDQTTGGGGGIGAGAVKPRGGVRRTALGPMLRILRSNSQFEEQEEEQE